MENKNNPIQTTTHGFDLEERCRAFARQCREYSKQLPKSLENNEYRKQLIRSSGSIGANYIEAISKKDFAHRIKISRKESRETHYWLELSDYGDKKELSVKQQELMKEVLELMKIFGAIYQKSR